jgi:hypothetical protein
MRNTLPFIALASLIAWGAWCTHAASAGAPLASGSTPVPAPTASRKIDEYGNIRWRDEKARLDNYLIELRNDPTARACVICYGGRRARAGEARRKCDRVADYLKRTGGIGAARIVTMDGGFREELTVELWLPSFGSSLPQTSPTVDPSEVTIIKDVPRRKLSNRPR